jgi:hypothetical protein
LSADQTKRGLTVAAEANVAAMAKAFATSTAATTLREQLKDAFANVLPDDLASHYGRGAATQAGGNDGNDSVWARGWQGWHRFVVLCGRNARTMQRDPLLLLAHYAMAAALALLLGGLFWQVTATLSGVQNRLGFIFFALAIFMFSAIASLEVRPGHATVNWSVAVVA